MSQGLITRLAGTIHEQGERVVGSASVLLTTRNQGCNRVWVGAPTTNHLKGSGNTGNILIGVGHALLTFSGNAADTETITLTRGGTATIFEFDSNNAVTAGRISVTIGADADATIQNLIKAINAAGISLGAYTPSTGLLILTGLTVVAKSAANIAITSDVNKSGSITLATGNNAGMFIDIDRADRLVCTGFNANDAVEFLIFG